MKKANHAISVKVRIPVFSFKEENVFIVYSPVLDISGYGNTEKEAQSSFKETLEEFIRYTLNKNTLQKELLRLGWIVKKSKYLPPEIDKLIPNIDYLSDIIREKDYYSHRETIQLPV